MSRPIETRLLADDASLSPARRIAQDSHADRSASGAASAESAWYQVIVRRLVLAWLLVACDPSARSQSAATGAQVAGATCSQIVDCIGACAETTCHEACIARGTPQAQASVRAIQQCAAQAQCADGDCVSARCGLELAACASGSSVAAGTTAQASAKSTGQDVVAPGPAATDEQFIFRRTDGLEMVSPIAIVSRGRAVALTGVWKDSLHGLTLEIAGTSYKLTYQSSFTTADSMGRPSGGGGTAHTESGTWQLDGVTMVLSPSAAEGTAVNANAAHAERIGAVADPPRRWALEGLMLSYQRLDDNSVHPVEGIAIAGPAPSWAYSPDGTWNFTLRRAR